jgi:hypothetical protein
LCARAERLARHRLSFFDLVDLDLGDPIDWNRDHAIGRPTPLQFAPLIDYRDWRAVGDAKVVWEPNRHHQLVVLGRAYRVTGGARYARAVIEQLESWITQCPFGRGMNWRSPLELAIRLINWVWAIDLILESRLVIGGLQGRVRRAAFQHLWLITRGYSRGSSANNHRIGEAAGVFVATSYFPDLDPSGRWREESRQILEEEIVAQTYSDGGSREQATGYHVFVLQFFLVAGLVGRRAGEDFSRAYWSRLERMLEWLAALHEGGSAAPMIGDGDDGYVLDVGDLRDAGALLCVGAILFARGDFARQAGAYAEPARWLLGRESRAAFDALAGPKTADDVLASRALAGSGYYLLQCGRRGAADSISVVFDCGELGFGPIAAHGHADALSFTLRAHGVDVLVDPGTYDYFSFPAWREYFRSTRSHNTVVVDGLDQSVMQGLFLWGARARARCVLWEPERQGGRVVGEHHGYERLNDPVLHRRTLELEAASRVLTIRDDVESHGAHAIGINFHLAEDADPTMEGPARCRVDVAGSVLTIQLDPALAVEIVRGTEPAVGGWVSRGYHRKTASATLVARARWSGNASFVTRIAIA